MKATITINWTSPSGHVQTATKAAASAAEASSVYTELVGLITQVDKQQRDPATIIPNINRAELLANALEALRNIWRERGQSHVAAILDQVGRKLGKPGEIAQLIETLPDCDLYTIVGCYTTKVVH